jgi:anti-anti-sigma regulatory factor
MKPARKAFGLEYYIHDGAAAFRFQLAGELSQDSARDLEQARHTASSTFQRRRLVVDLTGITHIDDSGRRLLDEWHSRGAELVVVSPRAKARIHSMINLPVTVVRPKTESCAWLSRAASFLLKTLAAPWFLSVQMARRLANPGPHNKHDATMRGES